MEAFHEGHWIDEVPPAQEADDVRVQVAQADLLQHVDVWKMDSKFLFGKSDETILPKIGFNYNGGTVFLTGSNFINKFCSSVAMLVWNRALWLVAASHVTSFI